MSDNPEQPEATQPDPTPPAPEQPAQPEPVPAPPAERTFTQAEVDSIVKDRLARTKKRTQPKAQTETPAPPQASELAEIRRELAEQRFEAAALRRGVTDEVALKTLKSAYIAESPADVGTWLDERKALFAPPTPATPEPTQAPEPQAPTPTVADGGAPSAPQKDFSGRVDILKLNSDDISRLQRTGRFHEVLERYRTDLPGGGNGIFQKRRPKG